MTTPAHLPSSMIPLSSSEADLSMVGGKGANLAKLAWAEFPVPNGFMIPTTAYREFVVKNQLDKHIQKCLKNLDFSSPTALQTASQKIRAQFKKSTIQQSLIDDLEMASFWLDTRAVAVRSSATAEDLPDMSFAGQQDTFLNVIDGEALLESVVACWSSLWSARAIGYRSRNEIPHEDVALAVIVQQMVDTQASGVLFTANPLTGKRAETVIDATLGLGEALVAGYVEPDHYVIDSNRGEIIGKSLGTKATITIGKAKGGIIHKEVEASQTQAVSDKVILQLTDIGQRIAAYYDFPQDIEWGWTANIGDSDSTTSKGEGKIYILQSRPITSLFPLPEKLPVEPLRVLIGFHAIQGILEPITPLGQDVMKSVLVSTARLIGHTYDIENQTGVLSAAERLWINMTPILRTKLGKKIAPRVIKAIDPGIAQAINDIADDPRLRTEKHAPNFGNIWRIPRFVIPFLGRVIGLLRNPVLRRQEVLEIYDNKISETHQRIAVCDDLWENYRKHLELLHDAENIFTDTVIPRGAPPVVAGMMTFFGILERFSKKVDQPQLFLEIARGLPHNVTTEMDLFLWETAQKLRSDSNCARVFEQSNANELASQYQAQSLPATAQAAVSAFMERYGMRGLGEIDIGRPRWREQPEYIMQTLQSYLTIIDPDKAPDVVFSRGADAAMQSAARLEAAVGQTRGGKLKARLIRGAVIRYRALAGMREAPKFFAIRMLGIIRQGLLESNQAFVEAGLLEQPDDLFFLYLRELDQISAERTIPAVFRERILSRRALRAREMRRTQLPRVLLSDGMAFYEGVRATDGDTDSIVGDPVSPGVVEGVVRVVFDPHESHLLPDEILVCPGTDPAWTPLFLAAGGLVMEVGGMMTHGSVVAREYGIPAVVGVHQATERLTTGQRIRVDGSSGKIIIL